jgi:ubiquinone/menaquinone biosynthesis C-methylase UbiE
LLQPESATVRWYQDNVRRFGYGCRSLGFGRRASQEKRFEAILALGPMDGKTVLDAGCGFGDLLVFLRTRGIRPQYSGLDACPPMIARCRQRFPERAATFVVGDVLEHRPAARYDYVIASGIFGLKVPGACERIRPTLQRLYQLCKVGLVVNFLSSRTPRPSPARMYLEPGEMLSTALSLTPAVRLDHSYLPNDFTLYLYREPAWEVPL